MTMLHDLVFGKQYALFASPMDPVPSVGHVRAFDSVMSCDSYNCAGIIVCIRETYENPVVIPYNTLSDRVELARGLKHVVRVTTYRDDDELYEIMQSLQPAYRIVPPSMVADGAPPIPGQDLGIEIISCPDLEATNYRVDLIQRIQRGQH